VNVRVVADRPTVIAFTLIRCSNKSCDLEHKVYFEPSRYSNFEFNCPHCGKINRFRSVQSTEIEGIIPPNVIVATKMN
jgi:hypothetical protein